MPNTQLNLIISSWPSAGGTTMALILAEQLQLKYIYAGGALKRWAEVMGYDFTSDSFHEWEHKYGTHWDTIWEHYIKAKLLSAKNFLYEGKTAGFLLPEGTAFEVMVIASAEVRAQRALGDGRSEEIIARDKLLQKRWYDTFGFDILSKAEIEQNYNFLLDNSDLTIFDSIMSTLEKLRIYADTNEITLPEVTAEAIRRIETEFWEHNKQGSAKKYLQDRLLNAGLYLTNDEIFADFKVLAAEQLNHLPTEMRAAIN